MMSIAFRGCSKASRTAVDPKSRTENREFLLSGTVFSSNFRGDGSSYNAAERARVPVRGVDGGGGRRRGVRAAPRARPPPCLRLPDRREPPRPRGGDRSA